MPYLYAAYRRGALQWRQGLGPTEFRQMAEDMIAAIIAAGGDVYTMMGQTPLGRIPVGVMTTDFAHLENVRPLYQPHAFWFPEASARNKMECTVKFLEELKAKGSVEIRSERRYWPFFKQLCKYGLIRPVGEFWGYLENGDSVIIYQGVNSFMKRGP